MDDHLFVYGTLLSGAGHSMHGVLARHAELVGEGFFNGRLYRLGHYPGAVASSEAHDRVFGEVYRLREAADLLFKLDEYEGCGPLAVAPTEYIRTTAPITLTNDTIVHAWVYVYNRPVHGLARIRSGFFLEQRATLVKAGPGDATA
ncbi:MAG: gamma-glutamylcyclotransferase family protein [Xanthobacteraceae bacterium]